jgi:hypothetical protein
MTVTLGTRETGVAVTGTVGDTGGCVGSCSDGVCVVFAGAGVVDAITDVVVEGALDGVAVDCVSVGVGAASTFDFVALQPASATHNAATVRKYALRI